MGGRGGRERGEEGGEGGREGGRKGGREERMSIPPVHQLICPHTHIQYPLLLGHGRGRGKVHILPRLCRTRQSKKWMEEKETERGRGRGRGGAQGHAHVV